MPIVQVLSVSLSIKYLLSHGRPWTAARKIMAISCSRLSPQGRLSHQGLYLEFVMGSRPLHIESIGIALVLEEFACRKRPCGLARSLPQITSSLLSSSSQETLCFGGCQTIDKIGQNLVFTVKRSAIGGNKTAVELLKNQCKTYILYPVKHFTGGVL